MSSHFPHVHIDLQKHGQGKVYIDGVEQKSVRRVEFEAGVDALNIVTLHLIAGVSYSGPAVVNVIESPRQDMPAPDPVPEPEPVPQLGKFD